MCDLTCSLDTYSLHHLTQEEAGAAVETFLVPAGLIIGVAGTCSPGLFRCTLVSLHTVVLRHEKMGGCTCGSCFRTFCSQRRLRKPKVNTPRGMINHFVCFVLFVYVNTE